MMTPARFRTLALLAAAALLASGLATAQDKPWMIKPWQEYVYQDDGFAIFSPIPPKREVISRLTDAGTVEVHNYVISLDWDHVLLVSCTDFGDRLAYKTPQQVIDDVARGVVTASGGQTRIVRQRNLKVMGAYAIEVEYVSGNSRFVSRIIYIKGVLFQLLARSPLDQAFDEERRNFFHSFRLLGRLASPPDSP